MKKLLIMMALVSLGVRVSAQAVNPQNSFSSAVNVNKPSVWISFNDATASFKDSVSGQFLTPTYPVYNGTYSSSTGGNTGGTIGVNGVPFVLSGSNTVTSILFQNGAIPATTQTFLLLSGTAPNLTIAYTFTATVAAVNGLQVLTNGVNYTAPIPAAGTYYLGNWVASGTSVGYQAGGTGGVLYLTGQSTLPVGAHSYSAAGGSYQVYAGVASTGTPSVRQPGFDNTNNSNFSVSFPYNVPNVAPNVTFGGTMEWNTPWTMMLHVNKLNWDHSNSKYVLASKGDLSGFTNNNWQLYVQQNNGNGYASQLCFARNGAGPYTNTLSPSITVTQSWCTAKYVDMVPNGFNYNIVVEDSGTGALSAISMWVNGYAMALQSNGAGFGGVSVAITSAGSGYPSSVTLTSTGGGANCVVTGTAYAPSGAITSTNVGSSGCTSAPTLLLASSTGSGAVLTATAYPMTMNSTTFPLMVPGYSSGGTYYGAGGSDSSQGPVNVDEFAEFPGDLPMTAITNIFYETKFYQNLLLPGIQANPPLVIFEGYGCGPDFSGDQTLAMVIGEAKAGLIRLIATIDDDGGVSGSNGASQGWWRQMLDQAGMADVAVGVGNNSPGANPGGCPAASITAYNVNTPQNQSAYPSAASVIRTQYAKYPTKPIYFLMTQTATGYSDFQLSAADSISPLTGLQLQSQNAANGGWVNGFNGNLGVDNASYISVFNHNGTTPIYLWGGGPDQGGPGIYTSRTANDPLYMAAVNNTQDTITGWTNLNASQVISPYFFGGVTLALSGGSGYAATTSFTSTGGGPNCNVTGIMTASGGVPNGIETPWGINIASFTSYWGLGYGCTSTPTIVLTTPTGTGVTITPTLGTMPASYGGANVNQYTIYPNQWAAPSSPTTGDAPIFRWFQNSLIDPPTTGAPRTY